MLEKLEEELNGSFIVGVWEIVMLRETDSGGLAHRFHRGIRLSETGLEPIYMIFLPRIWHHSTCILRT